MTTIMICPAEDNEIIFVHKHQVQRNLAIVFTHNMHYFISPVDDWRQQDIDAIGQCLIGLM